MRKSKLLRDLQEKRMSIGEEFYNTIAMQSKERMVAE